VELGNLLEVDCQALENDEASWKQHSALAGVKQRWSKVSWR
jgi:hypothetical protein